MSAWALTHAEDVMTSLQDMGLHRGAPSPCPAPEVADIWSPDAYGQVRVTSPRPPMRARANTSLGFGSDRNVNLREGVDDLIAQQAYGQTYHDEPPQFNNYVQKMENRLRQLQDNAGRSNHDKEDDIGPPPPPKSHEYYSRHDDLSFQVLCMRTVTKKLPQRRREAD